jgi:uncharacterized protein with NRDE domain
MCTLTYLPIHNHSFILTSNRDEKVHRSIAIPPSVYQENGKLLLYPKDPQGNGTWLAVSNFGTVACLLNGGLIKHQPNPPYRMSRGLVLLNVFDYENVSDFVRQYNFDEIEPFTLIVFHDFVLHEIRWTGSNIQHQVKDKYQPHIWSSVTLYSEEMIQSREAFFKQYLKEISLENVSEAMLDFHQFKGDERFPHSMTIQKDNGTKTVSISQVKMEDQTLSLQYFDLLQEKEYVREFYLGM